ncbi:MAG TPA: OmpA family protein [Kofleriaceae bacterium]|nr:OmpA family protein [Kofleriaceae bacterium]
MLKLVLLALVLLAIRAEAQPGELSQHPRVGELCEIYFPSGVASLPVGGVANDKIGMVAGWARANPGGLIVLDGHAGDVRDSATAVNLSMLRAKAVQKQLVALGVDSDRIVIAAFGGDRAGTQGRSVTAWATHQRVEPVIATLQAGGAYEVQVGTQVIPPLAG